MIQLRSEQQQATIGVGDEGEVTGLPTARLAERRP
jgi:hypothetical protein